MTTTKNIIFDLCGVLFEHQATEQRTVFSAIPAGLTVFEHCALQAEKGGHKLFACTNWTVRYIDLLEQDFPHIFQKFEGIVTSTVAQAKKPDVKIFNYLIETYGLIPEQSIFIDDQLTNVEAAKRVGIHQMHFSDSTSVCLAETPWCLNIL